MKEKTVRGYSRFTFFNIRILVTSSEGEEFIVDIIGRHDDSTSGLFRGTFRDD